MANLVVNAAEKWIEGGAKPDSQEVYIPKAERDMLLFGVRQMNLLAGALVEQFHEACDAKEGAT
jgi:hypothetical protein